MHRPSPQHLEAAGPSTTPSPRSDATPGGARDFAVVPPLAGLATMAALLDLAIHRVALPSLQPALDHGSLLAIDRWADLAANLAAIGGVVTLVAALFSLLRDESYVPTRRRLAIAMLSLIFVAILAMAVLFPTQRMTRQLVLFAVGASHAMIVLLLLGVMHHVKTWRARSVSLALASASLCAVSAQVVELFARTTLDARMLATYQLVRGAGEVGHLVSLLLVGALLLPRGGTWRVRIAWMLGSGVAGSVAMLVMLGHARFPADFPLVLYHAQRMVLLLEAAPWAYAVPLAIAMGAATAGIAAGPASRVQAGLGLLMMVAGGYAPRAPGRLLMLALAAVLIARTLLAHARQRAEAQPAASSCDSTSPKRATPSSIVSGEVANDNRK